LTLGEVEEIAPSAIWRLNISSHSTRSGFSHSLGRLPALSVHTLPRTCRWKCRSRRWRPP